MISAIGFFSLPAVFCLLFSWCVPVVWLQSRLFSLIPLSIVPPPFPVLLVIWRLRYWYSRISGSHLVRSIPFSTPRTTIPRISFRSFPHPHGSVCTPRCTREAAVHILLFISTIHIGSLDHKTRVVPPTNCFEDTHPRTKELRTTNDTTSASTRASFSKSSRSSGMTDDQLNIAPSQNQNPAKPTSQTKLPW